MTAVTEVLNMEQDTILMQDLFVFQQTGMSEEGRAVGRFLATGVRPTFMTRLESTGHSLPAELFAQRVLAEA